MKISVFGLGYVGAVSCACLPELGHEVIGVDTNPSKVRMINDGQSPVVDVASTANTTTLTRETLDLIPTARTGYNAIMAQAPGVRETLQAFGPTAGPGFRAFGQSNQGYQTFDGVQTTSPPAH